MKNLLAAVVLVMVMVNVVVASSPQDRCDIFCTGASAILAEAAYGRCNNKPDHEIRAAAVAAHKKSPAMFSSEDFENMIRDTGDREICKSLNDVYAAFDAATIKPSNQPKDQLAIVLKAQCMPLCEQDYADVEKERD